MGLPIVDFSKLGTKPELNRLENALSETGFLYLKNHGVSRSQQQDLIALSKKFFSEPADFKKAIEMKKAGHAWRGYFPVGGELTSGKPDQKEGIYFGTELSADSPAVKNKIPLHGANLWPTGPGYETFRGQVLDFMNDLTRVAQELFSSVALTLRLPSGYFLERFTNEPTILFRIFNYPKHVWKDEEDEWGVREHTDMGFLTILLQDENEGLQVKSGGSGKPTKWIDAPPIEDTFVINIGDMLEVWTHGLYKATPHRVRNLGRGDRISIPFFFDPNWNSTLEPIPLNLLDATKISKIPKGIERRWDGLNLKGLSNKITYGDFVWNKVKGVFPNLAP